MKKVALIVCLALLPLFAFAQEQVTKIVHVQYANAQTLARMASMASNVAADADNTLHVIVLKGQPSAVDSVQQTIRELDVPSAAPGWKDIEVIVSVIGASSGSDLPGQEMPGAMAPVVKQLRAIFPYKNYQLLSSMLLRSKEGAKAENKGNMKGFPSGGGSSIPGGYSVSYTYSSVSSEQNKPVIHLRNFQFSMDVPSSNRMFNVGVETDIDLPQGQKTVVGKANVESSDLALFVVLTARLVD